MNIKTEQICRRIRRQRKYGVATTHEFLTYASIFESRWDVDMPNYIAALQGHLAHSFMHGVPQRDDSSSAMPAVYTTDQFLVERVHSDLVQHAADAQYHDHGRTQHDKVQYHLHDHDPWTIATEVPVWGQEWNGMMDVVRLKPAWIVELPDFKPDLPRGIIKKTVVGDVVGITTKKMLAICSQVARYWAGLRAITNIPAQQLVPLVFNDEAAFKIIKHPFTT